MATLLQQHAQEHQAVGHPEQVGVAEVELELRVGAFADHILQSPAEVLEDIDDRAEKAHGIDRVLDVVAEGLTPRPHAFAGEGIVVERLDRLAVLPTHHDELGLDPRVSHEAPRRGIAHGTPERLAGTQVVGRVLPPEIREHPGAGRVPGADDQGIEVGHRDLVGVRRAQLGHEGDRVHSELRPPAHAQVLEIAERHRLGLRQPVHVDPAGEDVAHTRLGELRLLFADALDGGERIGHGPWCRSHRGLSSLRGAQGK